MLCHDLKIDVERIDEEKQKKVKMLEEKGHGIIRLRFPVVESGCKQLDLFMYQMDLFTENLKPESKYAMSDTLKHQRS